MTKSGQAAILSLPQFMLVADLSGKQYSTIVNRLLSLLDKKEDRGVVSRHLLIKTLGEFATRGITDHTQRQQIYQVLLSHLSPNLGRKENIILGKLLGSILHFYDVLTKNALIDTLLKNLNNSDSELAPAILCAFEGLLTSIDIGEGQYKQLVQIVVQKNLCIDSLLQPLTAPSQIHQKIRGEIAEFLLEHFYSQPSNKILQPLCKLVENNSIFLTEEQHQTLILKLTEPVNTNHSLESTYINLFRQLIQDPRVTEKLWERLLTSLSKSFSESPEDAGELTIHLLALLKLYPKITKQQSDKVFDILMRNLHPEALCHPFTTLQELTRFLPYLSDGQWQRVFDTVTMSLNKDSDFLQVLEYSFFDPKTIEKLTREQFKTLFDFLIIHMNHSNPKTLGSVIGAFEKLFICSYMNDDQRQLLFKFLMGKLNVPIFEVERNLMAVFNLLATSRGICDYCPELVPALIAKIHPSNPFVAKSIDILSVLIRNPRLGLPEREKIKLAFVDALKKREFGKLRGKLFSVLWTSPLKTTSDCPELTLAYMSDLITAKYFLVYLKKMRPKQQKEVLDDLLKKSPSMSPALTGILESDIPISIEQFQKIIQLFLKQIDIHDFSLEVCVAKALRDKSTSPAFISSLCETMIAYTGFLPLQLSMRYAVKKKLYSSEIDETLIGFLAPHPPSIVMGYLY